MTRVVTTQNNAAGKSSVQSDRQVELTGAGVYDIWETVAGRPLADLAGGKGPFTFFPREAGGTQFRLFTIPPADPSITPEQLAGMQDFFFECVGSKEARRDTSRHPMMHVTPTLDYILLLSGEISLVLDEGEPVALKPFDAVVQRGTNHSWANTGRETALLLAVMIADKA